MRKKHLFRLAVPILALLALLQTFPAQAAAAAASAPTTETVSPAGAETVSVPLFSEPQSLKLPHNVSSFWFLIPAGTKLGNGCSLTLNIKAAGTLLSDYSSVTLLVNNVQVASTRLETFVKNGAGVWKVSVPTDRLKTDGTLNELRIVTAQRSILGDCADIDNPSNWVTLEKTSVLNLSVLHLGAPELGAVLPYYFNRAGETGTNAEFVLPAGAGNEERSAMLTVASAAGAAYPAKDEIGFAVSQGAASGTENNRIFLGLGSRKPAGMGTLPPLAAGNGFLSVSQSGADNNLFVYGLDAAGLSKAAAFFTHSDFLSQLSGTSAVVTTDLRGEKTPAAKNDDGYYTLSDFGYSTVTLAGAFHQQTAFALKQPQDIRSGNDSYIEIHFRHSAALVGDTSLLTVFVNDVAVTSIQLSASNADGGTIKAKIPSDALNSGTVNVKVDCYNYLGKIDCSKDYYDTAWTVIDQSSVVYFEPGSTALAPTLSRFPVFDAQSSGGAGAALLCAPSGASASLLETAASLACRAGQNSGAAARWDYTNSLADSAAKSSDDILILSNNGEGIPAELAKKLSVTPGTNGSLSVSPSSGVTEEALRGKIVLQAVRSPWNFARRVYVVICPAGMEGTLKTFVARQSSLNRLGGTLALIDTSGAVTAVNAAAPQSDGKIPFSFDRAVGKLVRMTGISRTGLLIIFVCILLIIFLIFRVLANRRRFGNAKAKVERSNAPKSASAQEPEDSGNGDDR